MLGLPGLVSAASSWFPLVGWNWAAIPARDHISILSWQSFFFFSFRDFCFSFPLLCLSWHHYLLSPKFFCSVKAKQTPLSDSWRWSFCLLSTCSSYNLSDLLRNAFVREENVNTSSLGSVGSVKVCQETTVWICIEGEEWQYNSKYSMKMYKTPKL